MFIWGSRNGIPLAPGLIMQTGTQILLADGTAAVPSLSFASDTDTGWYLAGANIAALSVGGDFRFVARTNQIQFAPASLTGSSTTSGLSFAQTLNTTGVIDGVFSMAVTNTASGAGSLLMHLKGGAAGATSLFKVDMAGAGVFAGTVTAGGAQGFVFTSRGVLFPTADGELTYRNAAATGATIFNLGPTTGNTDRGSQSITNGKVTIDMATATGTGTGSITSPNTAIPAGSLVLGVTARVTTILAGAGLTTFSIGDGTDADRWGTGIAIAAGTTVGAANITISSPVYYTAATSIVLTAAAGVFSTGVLAVTVHYLSFTAQSA
jgi:hypothetical protein